MAGSSQEGTIFQNKHGQWMAMIELPRGPDGKRRRRLRRARTKAEAKAKLADLRDELRQTGTVADADANRTVAEAVETFRSGRPPSPNDNWPLGLVLSGLGGRKVKQLSVADGDASLADCAQGTCGNRPIGISHLRRVKQRLNAVLRNEVRLGMVMSNVAEVTQLPVVDVEPKERRSLTVDELHRLLDVADGAIGVLIELKDISRSAWSELDFVAVGATGQPIGREACARAMRGLCEVAHIDPHVTPCELRHTAISHQADAGRTSWEIADWVGMSESMISYRYRHRLRRVSRLLPVDDPSR